MRCDYNRKNFNIKNNQHFVNIDKTSIKVTKEIYDYLQNEYRKELYYMRKAHERYMKIDVRSLDFIFSNTDSSIIDNITHEMLSLALKEALSILTKKELVIILMFYCLGKTNAEISKTLNCHVQTVKYQKKKALKKLSTFFESNYTDLLSDYPINSRRL